MQIKTNDTPYCSIDVTFFAHHPQTHSPPNHPINNVQHVRCWPVHTHYALRPIWLSPLVALLGQLGRDPNNDDGDNATSTNACPSWRKDITFRPACLLTINKTPETHVQFKSILQQRNKRREEREVARL